MTPIPVLHVVEATTAGVKRHVLSLISHIDRQRFDIAVACPPVRSTAFGDTSFVSDLARHGVHTYLLSMRHDIHPLADMRAIISLTRLLRREYYPVVHAHSSKAGLLTRIAAHLAGGVTVIYTPNAFVFNRFSAGLRRQAYVLAERALARWTDVIICSSEGERQLALRERIGEPRKLVVIENAIEASEFQVSVDLTAQRADLGLDPEAPVVGTVGRLNLQKGFQYLIDAAPRIAKQISGVQFVVVGDGECRRALENRVRTVGVSDRFFFLGYRSDVAEIVATFDVFVLPSLYEAGVPFAILEAMAAGVPIVATRAPGLEALNGGQTSVLVPMRDADGLAQAVICLLTDRASAESLSLQARRWVEANFSIAQKVREIEELYECLLAEKTSSRIPST